MIFDVYCIRDRKDSFWSPRLFSNEKVAVRDFTSLVKCGEGVVSDFPDDFSLYRVGTFDNDSGLVSSYSTPKFIISGDVLKDVSIYEE